MSWTEFWHMGGYAFFVWSSYGVTALLILAEVISLIRQRKGVISRLQQIKQWEKE